jgi:hypothetical protein
MPRSSHPFTRLFLILFATLLACASPRQAAAQAYISPFLGYNFSGDAGCPQITDCKNKNLNWGASLGATNAIVGFELDTGYTSHFFGEASSGWGSSGRRTISRRSAASTSRPTTSGRTPEAG